MSSPTGADFRGNVIRTEHPSSIAQDLPREAPTQTTCRPGPRTKSQPRRMGRTSRGVPLDRLHAQGQAGRTVGEEHVGSVLGGAGARYAYRHADVCQTSPLPSRHLPIGWSLSGSPLR
jgi:hypothetical protein